MGHRDHPDEIDVAARKRQPELDELANRACARVGELNAADDYLSRAWGILISRTNGGQVDGNTLRHLSLVRRLIRVDIADAVRHAENCVDIAETGHYRPRHGPARSITS